jgi:hypothetical protein
MTLWRTLVITNLDELIAYSQKLAQDLPWPHVALRKPGCSPQAVRALADHLPGMPRTYLYIVEAVHLDRVSLGYFLLYPPGYGEDLTEKLISWNDPAINPLTDMYREHGVYHVASWEADPIGVVHSEGTFKVGQVAMYNTGNLEERPVVIGNTFEQFLLLASNLDAIRKRSPRKSRPEALSDFEGCVQFILSPADRDIASTWKERIADEVLS